MRGEPWPRPRRWGEWPGLDRTGSVLTQALREPPARGLSKVPPPPPHLSPVPLSEEKPFTNGETESQKRTQSSGLPDGMAAPALPRPRLGAFPLGAQLPDVACGPGSKGIWFLELAHVPGQSPLSLQVLGFSSETLVFRQLLK